MDLKEFMMEVGMLWFDNDPRTALSVKIIRAANYYRQKYGQTPNLCLVHPTMLGKGSDMDDECPGKVVVRSNRTILPGHLWIGKEEKN